MTGVVLALLSAVSYGASDFTAGVLSRRAHFVLVGWMAQATASLVACLAVVLQATHAPSMSALAWSVLAGLGGGVGTLALYQGLAVGHMSIAGPLSAVGAAGIPVILDLLTGGQISTPALIGIAVALPGIWLVSTTRRAPGYDGGVREGLLAGVGFAVLFIGLDRAGSGAGLWPVAVSQVTSLVLVSVLVAIWRPGPRPSWTAGGPGLLAVAATLLYFLSTHHAPLGVVAVITSLYPAITVGLAAALLRERTTRLQNVGLALCAAAVCAFAAS
ncbi:MAG TPA: EamA family transporter [Actinopolymorphaceae bacterium]|jgi:drug/metabolite transporter (DMT)-like permease|nr:EamA family transporter [Actinopolymorphaceae bacterium]